MTTAPSWIPPLVFFVVVVSTALVAGVPLLRLIRLRRRLLRELARRFPDRAETIRTELGRTLSLLPRRSPAPTDPWARTHTVTREPLGDGRPGFVFTGPGPSDAPGPMGQDGGRTEVRIEVAPSMYLIVHCRGRTHLTVGDWTVLPAEAAARHVWATTEPPGRRSVGPVDRLENTLGTCWRVTMHFGGPTMLTDTHVDHAGWSFAVGVLSSHSRQATAVAVLDQVLETWQWHEAEPPVTVEP